MFLIKGAKFLMLNLSVTFVKQNFMEFYRRKLIYDLYTYARNKLAQNVDNDLEYIYIYICLNFY